jgi:hypothetical protein
MVVRLFRSDRCAVYVLHLRWSYSTNLDTARPIATDPSRRIMCTATGPRCKRIFSRDIAIICQHFYECVIRVYFSKVEYLFLPPFHFLLRAVSANWSALNFEFHNALGDSEIGTVSLRVISGHSLLPQSSSAAEHRRFVRSRALALRASFQWPVWFCCNPCHLRLVFLAQWSHNSN